MPTQTEAGKAFEYALLNQSFDFLSSKHGVNVIEDGSFQLAKTCFNLFGKTDQSKYLKASLSAIKHIIELEPRLENPVSGNNTLTLQIVADAEGQKGDVRDVLFIRSDEKWEIGISAKNNHKALKHSRLSETINFGKEWLGLSSSDTYFKTITPIFTELRQLRMEKELWHNIKDKASRFYIPILEAFKTELLELEKKNANTPSNLLNYLIGNKDFYKVVKRAGKTEIYGFNLHGTLNKRADKIKPKFQVPKVKLPSRIIELSFKPKSTNTLILTCDEGWQIAFRIHSAESFVIPSLKFDVNLLGQPQTLYSHHLRWD